MSHCGECHTPRGLTQATDNTRFLAGNPKGPEDSVVPNLTPDKETGMGSWTEKMFVDAIKNGKHMGGNGRAILPPMPWMDLASLPEADLKSIYAFLKSIPAVRNPVPAHKVPEPVYAAITDSFEKVKKAMAARGGGK